MEMCSYPTRFSLVGTRTSCERLRKHMGSNVGALISMSASQTLRMRYTSMHRLQRCALKASRPQLVPGSTFTARSQSHPTLQQRLSSHKWPAEQASRMESCKTSYSCQDCSSCSA